MSKNIVNIKYSIKKINFSFQISGDMVATEVSDNETSSSHDDSRDMVSRSNGHLALARILRPGVHLQGRSGPKTVSGDMAETRGRLAVLPGR